MDFILRQIAHAQEFHVEQTGTLEHYVTSMWFLALVYAGILTAIWFGFARLDRLRHYRLVGIITVSLIMAFISYRYAPPLAVATIVLGFGSSLLLMVVSASSH